VRTQARLPDIIGEEGAMVLLRSLGEPMGNLECPLVPAPLDVVEAGDQQAANADTTRPRSGSPTDFHA
jgi:hypothetical protein